MKPMKPKKLLITGCHRSGTTLLASMIGSHSDIVVLNEEYFDGLEKVIGKKWAGVKAPVPNVLYESKNSLFMTVLKRKLAWVNRKCKFILKVYRIRGWYHYSISDFVKNRNAKIIFISRKFESNVNSIVKRLGTSPFLARKHVRYANKVKTKLKELDGDKVLFVELGVLTSKPEKTLMEVCDFLDVDFDEKMLDGYNHTPSYENDRIELKD